MNQDIDAIQKKIHQLCRQNQLELLEFKMSKHSGAIRLRCIVDYPHAGVTIDECVQLNKQIQNYLDTIAFAQGNYTIEVNSPGIDRPLRTESDFKRIVGKELSVFFSQPLEGRKSVDGTLLAVTADAITVQTKKETITIPWTHIHIGKEKISF